MDIFKPKRGDLVYYGGEIFYFRPNGKYGLLFSNKEDIYYPHRAIYSPLRYLISKPPPSLEWTRPKYRTPLPPTRISPGSVNVQDIISAMDMLSLNK